MDLSESDHHIPDRLWQQANEARLRLDARRWAETQETTLFAEEWGEYFVAVTREGRRLVLWMLDAEAANTDWIQSAMDLREPLRLQSSYTQAMILSLLWQPFPETVFLSGLGGGCLATTLHHHLTRAQFICVEIAAPVVRAATRFFGFQPDERLSVEVSDVRDFLSQDTTDYDLMFLDVFCDHGVSPEHATTADFLTLCCSRIRDRGLVAMNLGNRDPAFADVVASLCSLFATVYSCRGRGSTTVFFATNQRPFSHRQLEEASLELERRHDFLFPLTPWVERLKQLQPPPSGGDLDQGATPQPDR
ncbi:MAG: fused MFS/spermidine synthase [Caldilineaceae bacterium]|nr:fused MFS/spermidine synthase [Caldilineaceae bacterium]MDE0461298.1 fused MFS/spermidine synthase [Caldilineaceae bacterium]